MTLRDSPRFGLPYKGGTPTNVAPNLYIFCNPDREKKNRIAFLSTEIRKTISIQKYTDAFYDLPTSLKVKGPKDGGIMDCRAQRFKYKTECLPGPADYDPKIQGRKCPRLDPTPIPGKGKLYACKVPLARGDCAATIPTRRNENGYREGPRGLEQVPPDDHDNTLGPAFYKVEIRPCMGTRLYKGCRWSGRTGKRGAIPIAEGPGPLAYYPKLDCCIRNDEDECYRQMMRKYAFLPRYLEQEEVRLAKDDRPGPGHYDPKPMCFKKEKTWSVSPRPFISGAKRFVYKCNDAPAPYDVSEPKKYPVSKLNIPFGNGADRVTFKKIEDTPGPADYALKGAIGQKIEKKLRPYSVIHVPFDSLAERSLAFVSRDTYSKPGPDAYTLDKEVEKKEVDACFFKSRTCRFPRLKPCTSANAATYNINQAFKNLVNPVSHNKTKVAFDAKYPKCVQKFSKNPGPGEYYNPQPREMKGFSFRTTPREVFKPGDAPPPNIYKLHPAVCAMSKAVGTHNLRLKENIMRLKLRLPPWATKEKWNRERDKKKMLRWFSKPTEFYKHCESEVERVDDNIIKIF